MRRMLIVLLAAAPAVWLHHAAPAAQGAEQAPAATDADRAGCEALLQVRNLTITYAGLAETDGGPYCYVKGILPPAIHFHVQLPLPRDWNGRFLKWGDGGKDGDLDFADHRVAAGYAVANSNTGHDNGAEPGSSFARDNRQAEIDFGYRAVHLTTAAAKTLVRAYYGAAPEYAYFEGCSTGGRQGLMEAQRYPDDFDGIVAGAPANHYQDMNAVRVWLLQRMFRDDFAGALGFDTDGDGRFDSVRKLEILADAVLAACDGNDGVADGVIDDPLACGFDARRDLAAHRCPGDVDGDACFTAAQIRTVADFHAGPRDRHGSPIYAGKPFGSERQWAGLFVPYTGNGFAPGAVRLGGDHLNYLFYDTDPGVAPADLLDVSAPPDRTATPPEWAWWQFDIDDVTAGKGDVMKGITDAVDPDLSRFLLRARREAHRLPRLGRRPRRAAADGRPTTGRDRHDVRRGRGRRPRPGPPLHGPGHEPLPRGRRARHLGPPRPPRRLGRARRRPRRPRRHPRDRRRRRQRAPDLRLPRARRLHRPGRRGRRPGELGGRELHLPMSVAREARTRSWTPTTWPTCSRRSKPM